LNKAEFDDRFPQLVGWFLQHRNAHLQEGELLLGTEARLAASGGTNQLRGEVRALAIKDRALYLALLVCNQQPATMQHVSEFVYSLGKIKKMNRDEDLARNTRQAILDNSSANGEGKLFQAFPGLTYIQYDSRATTPRRFQVRDDWVGYTTTKERGLERLATFSEALGR